MLIQNKTNKKVLVTLSCLLALTLVFSFNYDPQPALAANLNVDKLALSVDHDPGDGICADVDDGGCNLQAALQEACSGPNQDITFDASIYGSTIDVDSFPEACNDLNIHGPGEFNVEDSDEIIIDLQGTTYINLKTNHNVTISGITITNTNSQCIYGYGNNVTIKNNIINNCDDEAIQYSGKDFPISNLSFDGNIISNTGRDGIEVCDDVSNVEIINNILITNINDTGILVNNSGVSSDITISNNTIDDTGQFGIWARSGLGTNTIEENTISNTTNHGIWVEGGQYSIEGNIISDVGESGILVSTNDNDVLNNEITNTGEYGINIISNTNTLAGNSYTDINSTPTTDHFSSYSSFSYLGVDYDSLDALYYYAGGGPGSLTTVTTNDTMVSSADGVVGGDPHNFNLALVTTSGATDYNLSIMVRNDVYATKELFKADCDAWGIGTCTVDLWISNIFEAQGATSSYSWIYDEEADPEITISGENPPYLNYKSVYPYPALILMESENIVSNETFNNVGISVYFNGSSATGNNIYNSDLTGLGKDILQSTTDSNDINYIHNCTFSDYQVDTGIVEVDYQTRVLAIDEESNPMSGLDISFSDQLGNSGSIGTTDAIGMTNYFAAEVYKISADDTVYDEANDYDFTTTYDEVESEISETIDSANEMVILEVDTSGPPTNGNSNINEPVNQNPTFSGSITNRAWLINTNLTDEFDLDTFFSDPDGDSLTYTASTDPAHVTVTINDDNEVSFAPQTDWTGDETVRFQANDGNGGNALSNEIILEVYENDIVVPTYIISGKILKETSPIESADLHLYIDGDENSLFDPAVDTLAVIMQTNSEGFYSFSLLTPNKYIVLLQPNSIDGLEGYSLGGDYLNPRFITISTADVEDVDFVYSLTTTTNSNTNTNTYVNTNYNTNTNTNTNVNTNENTNSNQKIQIVNTNVNLNINTPGEKPTINQKNNTNLVLEGTAKPDTRIIITIKLESGEEISIETITDSDGNWKIDVDKGKLSNGNHTIYIQTELNGKYSDMVELAKLVVEGKTFSTTYLILIIIPIVILIVIIVLIIYSRKKKQQEQTTS